jgi:ABC-type multidrug transport system ATPase subunit
MRDAQVLILDEPTAALDARAEFEVFQRFKELSAGKTAVLISHRFSSVRMADRILVLADGEVEAAGHARGAARAGRPLRRAVRAAGGRLPRRSTATGIEDRDRVPDSRVRQTTNPGSTGGHRVAKRPNYNFAKREKELKKQQKKAEKLEKKRAAKAEAQEAAEPDVEDTTP